MHALQLFYCAAAALLFRQLTDVRQEIQVLREEVKPPELGVQQALARQVLALKTEQDQQRTQLQTLQEKLETVSDEKELLNYQVYQANWQIVKYRKEMEQNYL